jgi:crotonobetainyl-CoA:carnitine CoA-transferase CaiB-like acyl-CoA transferase
MLYGIAHRGECHDGVGEAENSPGYDVILQAFCGIMSMTGDEDGGYIRSPISPIDQMTGVHAFSGILASLYAREKTGKGGAIQVSLFETALGLLGYNLQTYWERGVQPQKCGSSHESLCPYQAFEAVDGPIIIGVANDRRALERRAYGRRRALCAHQFDRSIAWPSAHSGKWNHC